MCADLKISVLTDNNAMRDSHLIAEHGLSLYVECGGLKLLFDTGDTDVYLKNAAKMGIDLQSIDLVAFSHYHYDHVGGIRFFPALNRRVKLVAQKFAFYPHVDYPNNLTKHEITDNFEIISVDAQPLEISKNIIFLGAIPELSSFEKKKQFKNVKMVLPSGELVDDYVFDDTALVCKTSEGMVVITGCSHSGICNIVQYAVDTARRIWGISKVRAVIGGLHLINAAPDLLLKTADFLKSVGVFEIYPCHCTDLDAKIALARGGLRVREVGVGMVIKF